MRALEAQFTSAIARKNQAEAILLLRSGFPANYQLNMQSHCTYPLILACANQLQSLVHQLLEYKADPNCQNRFGETPLIVTASTGNSAITELLIRYNADLYQTDLKGNTPLHIAATHGHLSLVHLYMQKMNVRRCLFNADGHTPFEVAKRRQSSSLVEAHRLQSVVEALWQSPLGRPPTYLKKRLQLKSNIGDKKWVGSYLSSKKLTAYRVLNTRSSQLSLSRNSQKKAASCLRVRSTQQSNSSVLR